MLSKPGDTFGYVVSCSSRSNLLVVGSHEYRSIVEIAMNATATKVLFYFILYTVGARIIDRIICLWMG